MYFGASDYIKRLYYLYIIDYKDCQYSIILMLVLHLLLCVLHDDKMMF